MLNIYQRSKVISCIILAYCKFFIRNKFKGKKYILKIQCLKTEQSKRNLQSLFSVPMIKMFKYNNINSTRINIFMIKP